MLTQLDMTEDLFRIPAADPCIEELVDYLRGRDWTKALQIEAAKGPGWTERKIRDMAARSEGRIISGNLGYKLTAEAIHEEMEHACARWETQAREMSLRARKTRAAWHTGPRRQTA